MHETRVSRSAHSLFSGCGLSPWRLRSLDACLPGTQNRLVAQHLQTKLTVRRLRRYLKISQTNGQVAGNAQVAKWVEAP
jgi:hypothetical protein